MNPATFGGPHAVKGTLYIDGIPAPAGLDIEIIFADETFSYPTFEWDGQFNYNVGMFGHEGETGTFRVFYAGEYLTIDPSTVYITNDTGIYVNLYSGLPGGLPDGDVVGIVYVDGVPTDGAEITLSVPGKEDITVTSYYDEFTLLHGVYIISFYANQGDTASFQIKVGNEFFTPTPPSFIVDQPPPSSYEINLHVEHSGGLPDGFAMGIVYVDGVPTDGAEITLSVPGKENRTGTSYYNEEYDMHGIYKIAFYANQGDTVSFQVKIGTEFFTPTPPSFIHEYPPPHNYINDLYVGEMPLPEICTWVTDKGEPIALTITDIFELVDSYLSTTPPTGYSFVPTLQNVFGVIDYYLGLNGDAATGCNFFP